MVWLIQKLLSFFKRKNVVFVVTDPHDEGPVVFPTKFAETVAEIYDSRQPKVTVKAIPKAYIEAGERLMREKLIEQLYATRQTDKFFGRLDKPFHRPECLCNECIGWILDNPR